MPSPPRPRTWGLRFSVVDGIVLALALVAAVLLWDFDPFLALLPAILLGHFFLFCNVFRIHRGLELVWAGLFLVNTCVWWLTCASVPWLGVVGVQAPVTVLIIALEMRSPRYHGIFASRINPLLTQVETSGQ